MTKLHGKLDALIKECEEKKLRSVIHYSSYWGTYSRTLVSARLGIQPELGRIYTSVELDLTPINSYDVSNWSPLKELLFRIHCTTPDRSDQDLESVPENVLAKMVEMYGNTIVDRMLTEDFLSKIDLEKLRAAPCGGTPLPHVLKDDYTKERYQRAQDAPRYCDCGIRHAPSDKKACCLNCGNCGAALEYDCCPRGCETGEEN